MEVTDSLWRPLKGKAERKRRIKCTASAYLHYEYLNIDGTAGILDTYVMMKNEQEMTLCVSKR